MECPLAAIFNHLTVYDKLTLFQYIYLFIIGMDGLARRLNKASVRGDLEGVRVARAAPPISHLVFADDMLVFCRSNMDQIDNLKRILQVLKSFPVRISYGKSSYLFSKNVHPRFKKLLKQRLNMVNVASGNLYLGFLLWSGHKSKKDFEHLTRKVLV